MSDLDGRAFVKRDGVLVPADFAAEEFLTTIPQGKEVMVTIRRPRSPDHHRWFFALLHNVVMNDERWADEEDLLQDLKLATHHIDRKFWALTNEMVLVPKSINFASMSEDQFVRFKNRCLHIMASAGIDVEALVRETDAMETKHAEVGERVGGKQ